MLHWFFFYYKKNNNEWNKQDERYRWRNLHEISGDIPDCKPGLSICDSTHRSEHGEPIRAETVQHEKKTDKGGIVDGSDAAERIFARSERRISHRPAVRPVGRSVGVADSNGRRSVSRLLRGSYVNMETGSWNPVLDSTYDSNQRG